MNIALFGGGCLYCQTPRIKEGIVSLGHKIDFDNPDIIYANDPGHFEQAINLKKQKNGKLILNILDIPWHINDFNEVIKKWKSLLDQADIITTISESAKHDLKKVTNKKIYVIYNPAKDVFYDKNIKKENPFLYVGRANDPNKRIGLVYETLNLIENGKNLIKICGTENPRFGNYLGLVSDIELNQLYNSSKFIFLTSKNEGIGLSMIEALICGSIPITCSDNKTGLEFNPYQFIADPNPKAILNKIIELNNNYEYYQSIAIEYGQKYSKQFNKIKIAENILSLYNI